MPTAHIGSVERSTQSPAGAQKTHAERSRADPECACRLGRSQVLPCHKQQRFAISWSKRTQRLLEMWIEFGELERWSGLLKWNRIVSADALSRLGEEEVASSRVQPGQWVVSWHDGESTPCDGHRLGGDRVGIRASASASVGSDRTQMREDSAEAIFRRSVVRVASHACKCHAGRHPLQV